MHKLTNWTVRRSGAQVVVTGMNTEGEVEKIQASAVSGPLEGRACAPTSTIAWKLDGTPVQLVDAMPEADKVRRVGAAVTQLERELIDEGRSHEAGKLVSAFASLPPASMARLHDILA